jgi:hypothetical protein
VGVNEEPAFLFRRANEIVRERAGAFGVAGTVPFICECRDGQCLERIELSTDEYDGITAHPERAPIAPGHEDAELERIVESTNRFAVVERQPQAESSRRSLRQ